ncbi:hypothetical protein SCHPADRAFT_938902 [Schizopora paradoxa]|uniref:DUF6533 domain-containing protein n=1 Tax=Schizopora paradoxa TaxID=27342 RepID=A0A0H2SDS3_9AGAM|nr:hypothetical protein SCHPADRAFT_938902 [Schizopora paradoxa]
MSSNTELLIKVARNTMAVKSLYGASSLGRRTTDMPLLIALDPGFSVCSWAVLLWDTIISFPDEARALSFYSSWQILYLATRYLGYVNTVIFIIYYFNPLNTPSDCFALNVSGTYILFVCLALSEATLVIRTYAIWGLSRIVLSWLCFSYLFIFGFSLERIFDFMQHDSLQYGPSPYPGILPCFPVKNKGMYYQTYILLMVFDLNLLVLTVWRAASHWKEGSGRLVHIVFRDGILYFASLAIVSVLNVIFFAGFKDKSYFAILMEPHRIFHVIFPLHLTLNVRRTGRQMALNDTSTSLPTQTSLCFRPFNPDLGIETTNSSQSSATL